MNLKNRFLTQSILILVITIVVTGCVGFAYAYFYNLLNKSSVVGNLEETAIVVIENDNIVYKSKNFSKLQVKEMLMNISVKKNYYDYENTKYRVMAENFTTQSGDNHTIITLSPIINLSNYYKAMIIFVFTIFIISFVIASVIVQKQNLKNIIIPIADLTKETERLRIGELETPITDKGYGEVRELGNAVEQLRLKLKNSIYYQRKYDENRKFT